MNPLLEPPQLETRHTQIRPPSQQFIEELYHLACCGQIPWQWHGRGETPGSFQESLWNGIFVQFAIQDRRNGQGVGLISSYQANAHHGFAYVSMTLMPKYRLRVWPLEGALLFANYLFVKYNLRNLYAESAEANFMQFSSGEGEIFEVEGKLKGHLLVNGQPQDLYILRISRESWFESGVKLLERCSGG